MADPNSYFAIRNLHEYRFVLIFGILALAITSIPYVHGAALATDDRLFGGFVYAIADCYSYLAKMRQGAEGAWLFHIAYTPEPHPGALFFPFHLLLGKAATLLSGSDLTVQMVFVYHGARLVFGLGLLLTIYRFLSAFTERVKVRRLAWLIVTFGGGFGWLLVALGETNWLGSMPLDFILPEGFTFLVLYAFPHIALGRTLLLWGVLFLLRAWRAISPTSNVRSPSYATRNTQHAIRNTQYAIRFTFHISRLGSLKWAALTGLLWLLMGLIVPFYVAVAWAITGAAWVALVLRRRRLLWTEALVAGVAGLISLPIVVYSAWVFTSDPVYATWAAQNRILSPHPLHYLAAYGVLLALTASAARDAWHSEKPVWLALAWVAIVPILVYLPFNLQRRLTEGVQVPLSLVAAMGLTKIVDARSRNSSLRLRLALSIMLVGLLPTNVMLIVGNSMALQGQPALIFRDVEEVAALNWLGRQVEPCDVVLASYGTGNYLPARVGARVFVGHGPESVYVDEKKALVVRFFDATTDATWKRQLLSQYGVDYVFWGPSERALGGFDPQAASYLRQVYEAKGYAVFEVEQ